MDHHAYKLDARRKQLGLTYAALAKRSHVSQATVVRILSGRHPHASFQNVTAIASTLGLSIDFVPTTTAGEMRRTQARAKARHLVGLVQGTSGLEAQAVNPEQLEEMAEQAANELLAGSRQKLWGS